MKPLPPRDRADFEIALICVLEIEVNAVITVFDKLWEDDGKGYGQAPGDTNSYTTGVIGQHNVVLAYLPGLGMGKVSAAKIAAGLRTSFPNTRLALVVGICGGIPGTDHTNEICLGDLIISTAVVQYDFGKRYPAVFEKTDTLEDKPGRPSQKIRDVLTKLATRYSCQKMQESMVADLGIMQQRMPEMRYPGSAVDITLGAHRPTIHFGKIGSGDIVMKSGLHRDKLGKAHDIIAFEVEGSGVWDYLPSIVIKGVCDYADSHKSDQWRYYAAAVATVGMKAFLKQWSPDDGTVQLGTCKWSSS